MEWSKQFINNEEGLISYKNNISKYEIYELIYFTKNVSENNDDLINVVSDIKKLNIEIEDLY